MADADAPTLAHLTTVRNARDLASAAPPGALAPHRLFRAACPAGAHPADIHLLVRRLGVRTLVDLRSATERAADPPDCVLMPFSGETGGGGGDTATCPRLVSTPILEPRPFRRALLGALPLGAAARVAAWSLIGRRDRARATAVASLNAGGLPLLYRTMLLSGGPAFGGALRAIAQAAEAGGAVLFFCRLGKDRTGLLAALLLTCLGAGREGVLADYSRSEADPAALGIALGGLERADGGRDSLAGLDAAAFGHAPREAMGAALDFLEARFGGVHPYLTKRCGFGPAWRARLAAAATAPKAAAGVAVSGEGERARL